MREFSEEEFFSRLSAKVKSIQPCPICGKADYSTYPKLTMLPVQDRFDGAMFGWCIPCGILMCKNCGHIHLLSLAALGIDVSGKEDGHEEG